MILHALCCLLWSSPLRAAGFPELDGDVHAFLRPAGVTAPATPRGAPVADPWIEKARAYYRELRADGYLAAEADFVSVDDADHDRSPGSADFDFQHGRCTVFLNERLMKQTGFDHPFRFQFMIYHELQHCQLFAHPQEIKPLPGLSEKAELMLSDLVQLEYFDTGDAYQNPRANGYGVYQETFADIKAMGVLLAQGAPRSRLDEIIRFRNGGGIMPQDPHNTTTGLSKVGSIDWRSLDPAGVDAQARALANEAIGQTFIRRTISADPIQAKTSDILAGKLQMPLTDLSEPEVDRDARASVRKALTQAEHSANPVWLLYARLAREGATPNDVAQRFFQARYGADTGSLAVEDEEIRKAVSR